MACTPKKKEYPDLICGIPRANLEQFARFICPYVEAYYADEKNMAEYQKEKENDKLSHSFHNYTLPKECQNRIPDFVVVKFR